MRLSENYENEGLYYAKKNIKTDEIIGAPSLHCPEDKSGNVNIPNTALNFTF